MRNLYCVSENEILPGEAKKKPGKSPLKEASHTSFERMSLLLFWQKGNVLSVHLKLLKIMLLLFVLEYYTTQCHELPCIWFLLFVVETKIMQHNSVVF